MKRPLYLIAGPVYVNFRSAPSFPPSPEHHAVLYPAPARSKDWGGLRDVGGSAWKLATALAQAEWAEDPEVVLVTRKPQASPSAPSSQAFQNDAAWLGGMLESDKFAVVTQEGGGREVDYTFHIANPDEASSDPILTIDGGTAAALDWSDLEYAWKRHGRPGATIVLSGVSRTAIPATLVAALKKPHSTSLAKALAGGSAGLKLVIDMGRTDFRHKPESQQTVRRQLYEIVPLADWVIADLPTVQSLRWLSAGPLPRHSLVVRDHRPGGDMQIYCPDQQQPASPAESPAVRWKALAPPMKLRAEQMVWLLQRWKTEHEDSSTWPPYYDTQHLDSPEKITSHPELRERLRDLADHVEEGIVRRVLIYGPTGTGKEVIAQWLHSLKRPEMDVKKPLVAVSGGMLTPELQMSELFGHAKGAFTGATDDQIGALERADRSTLLLDDIDTLRLETQEALLRFLQDGIVRPLGAPHEGKRVSLFLVMTTNQRLESLLKIEDQRRRLREDVYYRLRNQAFYLEIPPLNDRRQDGIRAAKRFWEALCNRYHRPYEFPKCFETALTDRGNSLRGNFRALETVVWDVFQREVTRRRKSAPGDPELNAYQLSLLSGDPLVPIEPLDVKSELLSWLVKNDKGDEISIKDATGDEVYRRLNLFLAYWKTWAEAHPQLKPTLSWQQISSCLQTPLRPSDFAAAYADWLANHGDVPQLRFHAVRPGRGAPWEYETIK
jgi:hypothetical protein